MLVVNAGKLYTAEYRIMIRMVRKVSVLTLSARRLGTGSTIFLGYVTKIGELRGINFFEGMYHCS